MIALVAVFSVLTIAAIFPWAIVAVTNCDGNAFQKLECLLDKHESTLIALGTLILISGLALLTTHLSNRSSERRERANLAVQAELKLSEFRQTWITSMRDDIAEFGRLVFQGDPKENHEVVGLYLKIKMRLNLEEDLAQSVLSSMNEARAVRRSGDHEKEAQALLDLSVNGGKYLKKEWSELKCRVRKAQVSAEGDGEETP